MLVPGLTFSATGRVRVTSGFAIVPDFINQGLGFKNDGSLCFELGPIIGSVAREGFPVSPFGCIYVIDNGLSDYAGSISGLSYHTDGRLIVALSDPDFFQNGNPMVDLTTPSLAIEEV